MKTWPTIAGFLQDGPAVLVTVAEARGSVPREAGARMAVRADGRFAGTIGGGTLEWRALVEAQKLLRGGGEVGSLDQALGPDLGQCCGGRVRLALERFTPADLRWMAPLSEAEAHGPIGTVFATGRERRLARPGETPAETFGDVPTPLLLFGAGHVGRALVLALAPLPFAVHWIDGRPDAFPGHVPANVRLVAASDAAPLTDAPDGGFVAVMTHSHALDLAIVAAALPDRRFRYVGLIGSETKRARFLGRLGRAGLSEAAGRRLVCPIGLPGIGGKEPAVIAAAVAAQLLLERERAMVSAAGEERSVAT